MKVAVVLAHHVDATGLADRFHQPFTISHCVRRRLLAQHMLAALHSRNRMLRVILDGRGDNDDIQWRVDEILKPGEQPLVGQRKGSPRVGQGSLVNIAQGCNLHLWMGGQAAHQASASVQSYESGL